MNRNWKDNLKNIQPYIPGEQSKNKDIIKLNANENPYPPSPAVSDVLKSFNARDLRLYPNADSSRLKEAIANYYNVDIKNVFVGNGSDDVIATAFQALFCSDLPIAFPDLTYSFYPVWCSLFNIKFKVHPVNDDFRINPEDYREENGGVIIPNPNAPTSIGEDKEFIKKLMEYNRDSVVIIDEAYVDFGGISCIDMTKEYENLLVTGTFSKSRSLAGMRIGYAIGSETLINVLEAIKNSYNSYTVDAVSIEAGRASILDDEYFKSVCHKIICTRESFTKALREIGFKVIDSSTNFVFATYDSLSMKDMFEHLKTKNIFIRYFNLPRIDNYVRITIGTDDDMAILIKEIKEYLKNVKA